MDKFDYSNVVRIAELRNYEFDPAKDIKRVEPCSVLLLSEVLASGVVPPDTTDMDYNEIESPENVAGRVTNVFDAIDLSKELANSSTGSGVSKPASSVPSGTSSATATPSKEAGNGVSTPPAGID